MAIIEIIIKHQQYNDIIVCVISVINYDPKHRISRYFSRPEALQWRYNRSDGVSNHRRLDFLLNRLFRRRSKEHQSSASLIFVRGIHRWPVDSPHKGAVTSKMFPFDDVIMEHTCTIPGPLCITSMRHDRQSQTRPMLYTVLQVPIKDKNIRKLFPGLSCRQACFATDRCRFYSPNSCCDGLMNDKTYLLNVVIVICRIPCHLQFWFVQDDLPPLKAALYDCHISVLHFKR